MDGNHTTAEGTAPRSCGVRMRDWLACLLLITPAMVPYLAHFARRSDRGAPTGFIHYDMAVYMANAREHFDGPRFRLTYSNPCSPSYDGAPIYFQPMTLLLGVAWRASGLDPGRVFALFGLASALACARVALALYREVVGSGTTAHRLGLVAFFWGGGVLALSGFLLALARGRSDPFAFESIFALDPASGLWFLNFGRNLVFPTEAFYHALSFGAFYLVLKRRYFAASLLIVLLGASHPFTGIEVLAILAVWAAVEVVFMEDPRVPRTFLCFLIVATLAHVGYYLVFLKSFPEHRRLMAQWENDWLLQARNFIPSDLLVGGLALWTVRRCRLARDFFAEPRHRLLLVWFLVAFALANHEFAVKPIQPIHFTRGYIWTPLFLMGAGTMVGWLSRRLSDPRRARGMAWVAVAMLVFLSDNLIWFGHFPLQAQCRDGRDVPPEPNNVADIRLTRDQWSVFDWINREKLDGGLILTRDPLLSYLANVYTPLRSWAAHRFNTPDFEARRRELDALFERGTFVEAWDRTPVLVILRGPRDGTLDPSWLRGRGAVEVFENGTYRVFRIDPAGLLQAARGPSVRDT
ncbi:MAG: hypothetical protein JO034_28700 [Singulisphaera sp.]|nr:hypothetical protein [Singulisphaera sp.]